MSTSDPTDTAPRPDHADPPALAATFCKCETSLRSLVDKLVAHEITLDEFMDLIRSDFEPIAPAAPDAENRIAAARRKLASL